MERWCGCGFDFVWCWRVAYVRRMNMAPNICHVEYGVVSSVDAMRVEEMH